MSPNFNQDEAARMPWTEWEKQHVHMAGEFDLKKEWESAQPVKEEAKPDKSAKKAE